MCVWGIFCVLVGVSFCFVGVFFLNSVCRVLLLEVCDGFFFCLLCAVGHESDGVSGDITKIVSVISICVLIGCVWWLK